MTSYFLSQAFDGFVLACQARRLSKHTINDYSVTLRKLVKFLDDKPVDEVTRNDLRSFLAAQTVSNKTLQNYHPGLSSFYRWALEEELVEINPVKKIRRPKAEQTVIQPIPKEHIKAILSANEQFQYNRYGEVITANNQYKLRHRAMLLLFLDTGMRVSELCSLKRDNVDLETRNLKILGNMNKERMLYYSPTTAHAMRKYSANLEYEYFFVTDRGRKLDRINVRHIIKRLCRRAEVPDYSPHDFRHTFAVNFLRNYPNIYALQQMLRHSTLDKVKRYLAISERDVQQAHKHASPVENWGL